MAQESGMKPLDECDVGGTATLAAYRTFRVQAHQLLKGDPEQSVWTQLVSLFWRDATYRTFNEARRTATAARPNSAIAPLLGEFIDESYVLGEVTSVARLTDPPSDDPSRGVVSLPTILRLVRANRDVITREMFVAFDGAPYDFASAAAVARTAVRPGVRWVAREPWDDAEDRHVLFDRLSRSHPSKRHRDDKIHKAVLASCEKRLAIDPIRSIRQHRNKIISHAADAASRGGIAALGLTLAAIDQVHRALLEVAQALSTMAIGEILVGGPIAIPQFDVLEGLEHPFAFADDLNQLQEYWATLTRDRDAWSRQAVEAVLGR